MLSGIRLEIESRLKDLLKALTTMILSVFAFEVEHAEMLQKIGRTNSPNALIDKLIKNFFIYFNCVFFF